MTFELLAEEVPFEEFGNEDVMQIREFAAQGGRPDLEAVAPDAPAELVEMMIECWAHEPQKRPGFREVVRRLEGLQAKLPSPYPFRGA